MEDFHELCSFDSFGNFKRGHVQKHSQIGLKNLSQKSCKIRLNSLAKSRNVMKTLKQNPLVSSFSISKSPGSAVMGRMTEQRGGNGICKCEAHLLPQPLLKAELLPSICCSIKQYRRHHSAYQRCASAQTLSKSQLMPWSC